MATHSSIVAWRILWTEEPGGLPSMGLQSQTQLKQLGGSSSLLQTVQLLLFGSQLSYIKKKEKILYKITYLTDFCFSQSTLYSAEVGGYK